MAGSENSGSSAERAPRDKRVALSRRGRSPHGTHVPSLAFIKLSGVGGLVVAVYVNLEVRSSAPTPLRRHAQFAVTTTLRGRCPSSPVLNKEYSGSCTLPFRWSAPSGVPAAQWSRNTLSAQNRVMSTSHRRMLVSHVTYKPSNHVNPKDRKYANEKGPYRHTVQSNQLPDASR